MDLKELKLILADDDPDDRFFFKEALQELSQTTDLTSVHDGEQLMDLLSKSSTDQFHVLFLDLNMPRKNGFECLSEIKLNKNLNEMPVIIISTSLATDVVNTLYNEGVIYYIRKPGDFTKLKKAIEQSLKRISQDNIDQPPRENFVIPD